jgi:palmitoyl-protein thioesterase
MQGGMRLFFGLLLSLCLLVPFSGAYKPIVFIHGLVGHAFNFDEMMGWINATSPETKMISLPVFQGEESLAPLWVQLQDVARLVSDLSFWEDGTRGTLIGVSQGCLLARSLITYMPDNPFDTLICMSGPLAGQFGLTSVLKPYLPAVTTEEAYLLFYTNTSQHHISVANYWHDPRYESLYLEENIYLPVLLNLFPHPQQEEFKANFLKTPTQVYVSGPQDGVITPYESAFYGYYAEDMKTIVPMSQQPYYIHDSFGLRTLDSQGGLHFLNVTGYDHFQWIREKDVFDSYILPYLH